MSDSDTEGSEPPGFVVRLHRVRPAADLFIHCFRSFGDVFMFVGLSFCASKFCQAVISSLISCLSMLCLQVCLSYGFLSFCHPVILSVFWSVFLYLLFLMS